MRFLHSQGAKKPNKGGCEVFLPPPSKKTGAQFVGAPAKPIKTKAAKSPPILQFKKQ